MPLTPDQLAELAADLAADDDLSALPDTTDGNLAVAAAYNAPAEPAFWVWRSAVPPAEYKGANGLVWSEVDALTAGKARIFDWLTGGLVLPFDPSDSNVRAGLGNAFTGTTAANLVAMSRRGATRAEALFSAGTGTTASPATMGVEGPITGDDVGAARDLP